MPRVMRRVVLEVEALYGWVFTGKLLDIVVLPALTSDDAMRPRVLESGEEVIGCLAKDSILT